MEITSCISSSQFLLTDVQNQVIDKKKPVHIYLGFDLIGGNVSEDQVAQNQILPFLFVCLFVCM